MGSVGEVSGIVTARQVLDRYAALNSDEQLAFFHHLERNFNADENRIKAALKFRSRWWKKASCSSEFRAA